MIEDVLEGIFRVLGRLIGQIFIEIVFEVLLKGPGYFISGLFTKGDQDPDRFVVVITGFIFWLVVGFSFYGIYSYVIEDGNA